MDERTNENTIECTYRRYRVQTPGGLIAEVESDKPLSSQLNAKLLEEESEINEFFKHHRVLEIRQILRPPPGQIRTTDLGPPKILAKDGTLNPRQRLNQLLKMKGEFTRMNYERCLFDEFKYKINKWTSHSDIRDALRLNKIEMVEERKGKKGRLYRVVSTEEVEKSLYEKLLQDRKLQINTLA